MAEILWWRGHATTTTAVVCVRTDTAGTVTVACNGQSFSAGALDPAVEYGLGKAEITGLASDSTYSIEIKLDGVTQETGNVRTMPTAGGFSVGYGSCIQSIKDLIQAYPLIRDYDIRAFFDIGDMPYAGEEITATSGYLNWKAGSTVPSTKVNYASRADWDPHFEYLRHIPGFKYLQHNAAYYKMYDNEDIGGNWDHSVSLTTAKRPSVTTQAEVDLIFERFITTAKSWMKGNPANSDSEALDWKPSSAAAAASKYNPLYFRGAIGPIEFFSIDTTSHRCAQAKTGLGTDDGTLIENDVNAKTILGRPQKAWLKARLLASTAPFKVIFCPKKTFRGNTSGDQIDWHDFPSERAELISWINSNVTGVVWCSGDTHAPCVINDTAGGHACINACPVGHLSLDTTVAINYGVSMTQNMVWQADNSPTWTINARPANAGIFRVAADWSYMECIIMADYNEPVWTGRIYPDKNYVVYPALKTG